jgi:hypothetical protein
MSSTSYEEQRLDERQFKKEKNTMSAHGANLFPVFSEQGLEPTDLHGVAVEQDPATQTLRGRDFLTTAPPAMTWRDPASLQEQTDAAFRVVALATNPRLTLAVEARERAARVAKEWRQTVTQLREAVSNLQNLCQRGSVTSEDSALGSRSQRLLALNEQYNEAVAEHSAACEELQAATAAVDSLVGA